MCIKVARTRTHTQTQTHTYAKPTTTRALAKLTCLVCGTSWTTGASSTIKCGLQQQCKAVPPQPLLTGVCMRVCERTRMCTAVSK